MTVRFAFGLFCSVFAFTPHQAVACSAATDCTLDSGTYRISLPDGVKPAGAIVFAHGYRGSAAGVMKNLSLIKTATDRGLALIAIDAGAEDWNLPNAPHDSVAPRDEMAYLDAVMADAQRRFGVDPKRAVITGFSAGGMFVWNVACARGDAFAGYIPYAGTFWKGPPATCPAPSQNIIHIHGTRDTTVPMAGRKIGNTRQGDMAKVLTMYMADKGFSHDGGYAIADMGCSHTVNTDGKVFDLCLFDGDHSFTAKRLGAAYDRLMPKG